MFTDAEIEYLNAQPLGRLATVGPKGDPQNNPVGFSVDPETGVITVGGHSMAKTRKYRNVQGNPQVALVVDDLPSVNPWTVRGLEIRGDAETLDGQKTPQGFSPEVIRVRPRTVFSWGINTDVQGMERRDF